ncbi:MAG: flavin reductase [Desulfurococcales archaeon]|nr:flavin reductase [Desulfurococcales archaeon]
MFHLSVFLPVIVPALYTISRCSSPTTIDRENYYVLHPRPVYLIVTRRKQGGYNVMAASWVMPVSEEPPLVALAISKE